MLLKDALSSGALYTPFPVQIEGLRWKGARFDFSPVCNDGCFQGQGKYYCRHGLAYKWIDIVSERVLVCGYVDADSKINREDRARLINRSSTDSKISTWAMGLKKLMLLSNKKNEMINDLGSLHEITRWASQVHTIAQRMLVKDKSIDFAANFQSASKDLRSLFKASEMLVDSFDYLGIYFNPSSAAFGRKRPVDLYKLVDKIRIILMEAEGAALNKKIYITGELRRSIDLYESFKIIPFCLLQNAIKYSFDGEINISFSSSINSIEMAVESSGPPILDDEKFKIFEKGYRGARSKEMHHEGIGVGLYIAKIVADAHDIQIKVRSATRNYSREGIHVHSNIFSIKFSGGSIAERRNITR